MSLGSCPVLRRSSNGEGGRVGHTVEVTGNTGKSLQTGADVSAGERLLARCFSRPGSVGIHFVPTARHITTRDPFPKRFVVVEVEMTVHFHRIDHARPCRQRRWLWLHAGPTTIPALD